MNSFLSDYLRPMVQTDLELVLAWRNHPEVRRYMYTRHEIALEEHASWYARASVQPGRHLLIFEIGGSAQGFVNLHESAPGGIAEWGFYVAPDASRGTGGRLGQSLLNHAFEVLGLHKLCAEVLGFNERSIRFHLRLGFQQEGLLRQQHFDGQGYHDVLCFGLLAADWRASREN